MIFDNVPLSFCGSIINIIESPNRSFVSSVIISFADRNKLDAYYTAGRVHEKSGGAYDIDYHGNGSQLSLSYDRKLYWLVNYVYPLGGENVFAQYTKATSYLIYQDY